MVFMQHEHRLMSYHLIPTWHKWNDVVHIICEPCDIMSGMHIAHTCMAHMLYINNRILDFCTFIPFLQYIQSVFPRCLCTGNRGFGSEGLKLVKLPLLINRHEFLPRASALLIQFL